MAFYTDQTGNSISLPAIPRKIISLVPSQTELLADLELDDAVVGITKFCVHPETWFRSKRRIGGTKQLNVELILQLAPDLVLANKEENSREQVESIAREVPVWISDIQDVEEAIQMILSVGQMTDRESQGNQIAHRIREAFSNYTITHHPRTAYLIWQNPLMTVGGDTFIHAMMDKAGLVNVFAGEKRYPTITASMLAERDVELLLLSSEPYPFTQQHAADWRINLPRATVLLADGELFSWYGSRMQLAPAYFAELVREYATIAGF